MKSNINTYIEYFKRGDEYAMDDFCKLEKMS